MASHPPLRVVIAGGTGHVGRILSRYFGSNGGSVTVLTRRSVKTPGPTVAWDGVNLGPWVGVLEGADVLINLVGRSVDCRYSATNRRAIMESRIGSTQLLGKAVANVAAPPRLWINASTATIYRHAFEKPMNELSGELGGHEANVPPSWGFSIDVAKKWEAAFFTVQTPHTRKVAMRSAMTMSPDDDGIFDVLLRLVRFGLGGTAGSGKQFVSWIHEVDFVRAVAFLISNEEMEGCVNLCAPLPLPNREFMQTLRHAYGRKIGLPASRWMLEVGAFLLRTETELILKSRRVVPGRLLDAGFQFKFPDWASASRELVCRWRAIHA